MSLAAMGVTSELARAIVRFSLGRETTASEIDKLCLVLPRIIARAARPIEPQPAKGTPPLRRPQ